MDYIMIRAWGQFMGSMNYYIRDQISIAKEDKAPHNAIYKSDEGEWVTIESVKSPARETVERIAAQIQRHDNPQHPVLPKREIR